VAAAVAALLLLTWPGSTPALATAGRTASPAAAPRAAGPGHSRDSPAPALPGIDPHFVYDQLAYMVAHFQHREAGYAAGASGHTGFAQYWTAEMLRLLGRFGASARSYAFRVPGWAGRPATAPAVDVEVTVPGVTQPAQVVVIGCHYDGEASSTQSAFDDASGCAVELGVARAMAGFWRGRGLYPARTLRFVIFDAEEQGLYGSFDYVNDAANGSLPAIVAMFNEEQNGIGYPLRFLGQLANPVLPTHLFVSPTGPGGLYRALSLSAAQAARTRAFAALLRQATAGAFQAFRQLGNQELTYHGAGGEQVWQPIFTPDQLGELPIAADTLGSSDQVPFTLAGVPDVTIAGNYSYYTGSAAPAASYPYDQPQDTIGLMNTFADGGAGQSQALSLALAVPGMLTAWMLAQPGVLGLARPGGRPIAAIGSIGPVRPGRTVALRATAFDPGRPRARLGYSWEFGDGAAAAGPAVRHVYAVAGHYTLQLTVTAPGQGPRVIRQAVSAGQPAGYANPYAAGPPPGGLSPAARAASEGRPLANPSVALPAARPGLGDRVARADEVARAGAARPGHARPGGSPATAWILAGVAALVAAVAVVLVVRRRAGRARRRAP
jgi:Peptidase family M28/PKD domain